MYALLLVPSLLNVYVILTWWRAVSRLGFTDEIIRRAPNMLPLDVVAIFLAVMVGYLAIHAWTGFSLTFFGPLPQSDLGTTVLAMFCCFISLGNAWMNASDRFSVPTVAGLRESAVRTLVTLRIIDRAEDILKEKRL